MLTLKGVRAEVANYGRPALREAAERVLWQIEAICRGYPEDSEISRAHLEPVAKTTVDPQELLVIGELCRIGRIEIWPRPARLLVRDTPLFERKRRISDMIASTLAEATHPSR